MDRNTEDKWKLWQSKLYYISFELKQIKGLSEEGILNPNLKNDLFPEIEGEDQNSENADDT